MSHSRIGPLVLTLGLLAVGLLPLTLTQAAGSRQATRSHAHRRAAPPGAIVHNSVQSLEALNYQVAHYGSVRQRFAQFFGKPVAEIPAYVRDNISIGHIDKTRVYTVYYINGQRRMKPHQQTLYAGNQVFVLTRTRQPVLNWDCGNPIDHDRIEFMDVSENASHFKVAIAPVEEASPSLTGFITPGESGSLDYLVPGFSVAPLPFHASPHLLPLAALALFGLDHHHSPPGAVPEPSALALLLVALPVLGLALRRRARAGQRA